jgi:indolepyruvate ferredoxin oxidoreductase alpha subunit
MKSDGLNVALDFLTSMNLAGSKGGLVLVVADDPAAHSSLKEHDSRNLARAAQVPVLEPSTPDEARAMASWAFDLSEEIGGPVLVRSVTRVSHSRGIVELRKITGSKKTAEIPKGERFQTFSIFHMKARDRLQLAASIFETSPFNFIEGPQDSDTVLFCCGSSYLYARETLKLLGLARDVKLVRVGTTYPLPEDFILSHLRGTGQVIFAEEVRPVLEESILLLYARNAATLGNINFHGKISGEVAGVRGPACGEMNTDILLETLAKITGVQYAKQGYPAAMLNRLAEKIPPRDFAMCPGCPHRASFWAIKTAVAVDGRNGIINGDIGCYSLGAFTTGFELFDTLHCMGAGAGIACGLGKLKKFGFNRPAISVVGDSTFFHAVIPGLINARYNGSEFLCVVLDNGATAMTGHQPHPGTGFNAAGDAAEALSIEEVVRGLGIAVEVSDPYDIEKTSEKIFTMSRLPGVKVLILRQLCALVAYRRDRKKRHVAVDPERCRGEACGCNRFCTSVWGCPGNIWDPAAGKAKIDEAVCAGCGVCAKLCPAGAITVEEVD